MVCVAPVGVLFLKLSVDTKKMQDPEDIALPCEVPDPTVILNAVAEVTVGAGLQASDADNVLSNDCVGAAMSVATRSTDGNSKDNGNHEVLGTKTVANADCIVSNPAPSTGTVNGPNDGNENCTDSGTNSSGSTATGTSPTPGVTHEGTTTIAKAGDDGNEKADADPPMVFEGPEKCLEVDFCVGSGPIDGLRTLPRSFWDKMLLSCGCEIISVISNDAMDSYVLSESSMFISRWKMVLKTCGKTTPLLAIPHLQRLCSEQHFELEWMGFSRKNYNFPVLQVHPHANFSDEVLFIQDTLMRGEGHILGPLTGDHWYLYVAELTTNYTHPQTDFKMDIMMCVIVGNRLVDTCIHVSVVVGVPALPRSSSVSCNDRPFLSPFVVPRYGLDPAAAALFMNTDGSKTAEAVRAAIEFEQHLIGARVHDVLFEPCGYSLNALRDDT